RRTMPLGRAWRRTARALRAEPSSRGVVALLDELGLRRIVTGQVLLVGHEPRIRDAGAGEPLADRGIGGRVLLPVGEAVLLREPRQIGAEAAEIPGCGRLDVCARVVAHVLAIGLLGGAGRGAGGGVRGVRAAPDGLGEAPRADRDRAPGEQRDERRSEQNEDPVRHHRPPSVSARWRWYSSIAT